MSTDINNTKNWLQKNNLLSCWTIFEEIRCDELDNIKFVYNNEMLLVDLQEKCDKKLDLTTKKRLFLLLINKFGDDIRKIQMNEWNEVINTMVNNIQYMTKYREWLDNIRDLSVYLISNTVSNIQTIGIDHIMNIIKWWNNTKCLDKSFDLNFNGFHLVMCELIKYINNYIQIATDCTIQIHKAICMLMFMLVFYITFVIKYILT